MSTFQGKYVEDVKSLLIAAAVSHQHVIFLSEPGSGKTAIARSFGESVYGDSFVFIRLDASTPPENVKGEIDFIAAMNNEKKIIVDGTPYDPKAKMVMADEVWRAMNPVWDVFLDVMDRQDINQDDAPIIVCTSNFVADSERTEAVRDRIGLWMWIPDEPIDVQSFVRAQMESIGVRLSIGDHLPSMEDIKNTYAARPGERAIKAITNVIDRLKTEAEAGAHDKDGKLVASPFKVNRRRVTQWQQLLYRVSVYYTQDADFSRVPDEAIRLLKYAYPCLTRETANQWETICNAIVDPVDTALATVLSQIYQTFRKVANETTDARDRMYKLGSALAEGNRQLVAVAEGLSDEVDEHGLPIVDDEIKVKIDKAIDALKTEFSEYIRGNKG